MTSFLARLGQLEARALPSPRWTPVKGERGEASWMCRQCRVRYFIQQRRFLHDNTPGPRPPTLPSTEYPSGQQRWTPPDYERTPPPARRKRPELDSSEAASGSEDLDDLLHHTMPWGRGESQEALQSRFWESLDSNGDKDEPMLEGASLDLNDDVFLARLDLDLDHRAIWPHALREEASDAIMRCLLSAAKTKDLEFIKSISAAEFSQALIVLQPARYLTPIIDLHRELSTHRAALLKVLPVTTVVRQTAFALMKVLKIRREAGMALRLDDYRLMLRSARDFTDVEMAQGVWSALVDDGFEPDTECYNIYMAAFIWHGSLNYRDAGMPQRVVDFWLLMRSKPPGTLGVDGFRVGRGGVKEQVTSIFVQMMKMDVSPDADTFCNVMLASAKEGDMATVKSILRRVWHIDVDALMSGQETNSTSLGQADTDPKLRPDGRFLFTLAHMFGINNDVATAMHIVGHVAKLCNLEIGTDVWVELLNWTYVLSQEPSRDKPGKRPKGMKEGQIPLESVLGVWRAMTSPPHNVKPTMAMYHYLVRSLRRRNWPEDMFEHINRAHELVAVSRTDAEAKWVALQEVLERPPQSMDERQLHAAGMASRALEDARHAFELATLRRKLDHNRLTTWLQLILIWSSHLAGIEQGKDWGLRHIPRLLWEWDYMVQSKVVYEVPGGRLGFQLISDERQMEIKAERETRYEDAVSVLNKAQLVLSDDRVFATPSRSQRPPDEVARKREGVRKHGALWRVRHSNWRHTAIAPDHDGLEYGQVSR